MMRTTFPKHATLVDTRARLLVSPRERREGEDAPVAGVHRIPPFRESSVATNIEHAGKYLDSVDALAGDDDWSQYTGLNNLVLSSLGLEMSTAVLAHINEHRPAPGPGKPSASIMGVSRAAFFATASRSPRLKKCVMEILTAAMVCIPGIHIRIVTRCQWLGRALIDVAKNALNALEVLRNEHYEIEESYSHLGIALAASASRMSIAPFSDRLDRHSAADITYLLGGEAIGYEQYMPTIRWLLIRSHGFVLTGWDGPVTEYGAPDFYLGECPGLLHEDWCE
jgi:hypothetical protein